MVCAQCTEPGLKPKIIELSYHSSHKALAAGAVLKRENAFCVSCRVWVSWLPS